MSSISITLISLIFSSIFLYRLIQLNPKRIRVHKLAKVQQDKERTRLLWILVVCPALVLLFGQLFSAFIMWVGGLFIIGWVMALMKP